MYKLLVVDDEYEIRNGLCRYFPWDEIGFEVVGQAENGKQALDFLEKNPIDVVLSDIKMPVMSGIDLAAELHSRKSKVKIVFLSGYRDFEYVQKALVYGAKNYIVKSTKYNELVGVFKKVKEELDEEYISSISSAAPELQDKGDNGSSFNEKIIGAIKNYIQQNYKDAELEDVAELVHMNPFYVSKFFKQKTGQNFSDYLMEVRMEKAAALLRDIRYKTYEVSTMVGYSNAKNFARTFKSYFGKSPREFRNED